MPLSDVDRAELARVDREKIERGVATPQDIADRSQAAAALLSGFDPRMQSNATSEEAKLRIEQLLTAERRLNKAKATPASVLNLRPFPLSVNSPLFASMIIPPKQEGRPYRHHVIRKTIFDWADKGDAKYMIHEIPPIIQAEEFERLGILNGGVVVFEGDFDPASDEAERANPGLRAKIAAAEEKMVAWFVELFREAEQQSLLPNKTGIGNIGDNHRIATAELMRRRLLKDKPMWLELKRAEEDIAEPCPRCKAEPKKGAYMCPACGFIIDPKQAYLNMEIDGSNLALARLKRSELDELGITRDEIPETMDERRNKANTPKPSSRDEVNLIDMNRRELVAFARKNFGLELKENESKDALIEAIENAMTAPAKK